MENKNQEGTTYSSDEPLTRRETTMETVASSLAIMFIEDRLKRGGEIDFPTLDIKITKNDLNEGKADHKGGQYRSAKRKHLAKLSAKVRSDITLRK